MIRFLEKPLWWTTILIAVLLVLAHFSPHVHPQSFAWAALLGLGFVPLLFCNLLFLFYWLFRKRIYLLLPLFVLILSNQSIRKTYAFSDTEKQFRLLNEQNEQFKLFSQNVEVFNIYKWQNIENARDKILQQVLKQEAEIIAFQEFYTNTTAGHRNNNIEAFSASLGYKYHFFAPSVKTGDQKQHQFGVVLFSKYPIKESRELALPKTRNQLIYCDIELPNKTVRVFNGHLQSIYFNQDEFDLDLDPSKAQPTFDRSKSILRKLRMAFAKRSTQTDMLTAAIERSPYPVLVCGDFNDTPISYTYNELKKRGLKDTFRESSSGIGATYAGNLPLLRIDYILCDTSFVSADYHKFNDEKTADHYAISASFGY